MKKISTLIFFLIINTISTFAQNIELSGQVKDKNTKVPVSWAVVRLYSEKDSLLLGTMTNEKGFFVLTTKPGIYKMTIEQIGYKTDTITLSVSESKFLGNFLLELSDKEIGEVVIKSSSLKSQVDRQVQYIGKREKEGASNTYEVLERVQGVSYDRFNNKIKVDNSDKILILINGLEKDPEYIKNLNPDRILKVEIIRNPSGKYAMDGYKAIVNIILKDNFRGFDVFLNNSQIIDYNSEINFIPANYTYFGVNFVNKNINLYTNYTLNFFNFQVNGDKIKIYNTGEKENYVSPSEKPNLILGSFINSFVCGFDYFLNPKNSISVEIKNSFIPRGFGKNESHYFLKEKNIDVLSQSINSNYTFTSKVYYIGNFSEKTQLTVSLFFTELTDKSKSTFIVNSILANLVETSVKKPIFDFNAELTQNLTNKLSINFGNQELLAFSKTLTFVDNSIPNDFLYQENRIRNYLYFNYKISNSFILKAGLGNELMIMNNSIDNKKIFNGWQPHIDFQYRCKEFFDVTLKYRSIADYPGLDKLNPIVKRLDINVVEMGNSSLKPAYRNNISLRMNILGGLLAFEPYYEFENNSIISYVKEFDGYDYILKWTNVAKKINLGVSTNLTIPFGKAIILQTNYNSYKQRIINNFIEKSLNGWLLSSNLLYINQKHSIVGGIIFQKNLYRDLNWMGYNSYGNDFWGIFLQKVFFKNLNIMFMTILPINFGTDYNQEIYTQMPTYEQYENVYLEILKHIVLFNVSYRFSKGKEVNKIEKREESVNLKVKKLF